MRRPVFGIITHNGDDKYEDGCHAGLIGAGLLVAAPAFAQGVYIGPGGIGVDTGIHRYRDDYYRGRDREYDRDRGPYEGRSVYRDGYGHDRD